MRIAAIAILLAGCFTDSPPPPPPPPSGPAVVATAAGAVRGRIEGDVAVWRGIPYAAPPVGELRWREPQPVPAWDGVRDAASFSSTCVQISTSNALEDGGEDCLYLNVWAPATTAGALPVLVFIHGGFALNGSASHVALGTRFYDGAHVAAAGPAVVVTINYRLGAFGYFTSSALAAESTTHASGDYAVRDMIAALAWVQANIAGFGGDPAHVLVYGESAGGSATCQLFASPRAAGLFSAALIESGGCGAKSATRADALSQSMVHALGCDAAPDALACLRAAPADAVAIAAPIDLTQSSNRWGASVDGDVLPTDPLTAIRAGQHNHLPLVIGNTTNEFSTLIAHFLAAPITTDADYRAQLARFFGAANVDAVAARYPSASFPTPQQALIAATSDAEMVCPSRVIARAAVASQTEPVRRYMFAHTYESGPERVFGAGHALDLPFEFGNLGMTGFAASPGERALADAIIGYWTRFAATGDPNGAGIAWQAYDATDPAIVLDDTIAVQTGVQTAQCDFWDSL